MPPRKSSNSTVSLIGKVERGEEMIMQLAISVLAGLVLLFGAVNSHSSLDELRQSKGKLNSKV